MNPVFCSRIGLSPAWHRSQRGGEEEERRRRGGEGDPEKSGGTGWVRRTELWILPSEGHFTLMDTLMSN